MHNVCRTRQYTIAASLCFKVPRLLSVAQVRSVDRQGWLKARGLESIAR